MYTHIACSNGNEVFKLIIIVVISVLFMSHSCQVKSNSHVLSIIPI